MNRNQDRDQIIKFRKSFVTICENNYCAAMLLDMIHAAEILARQVDPIENDYDPYLYTSIAELTECLFGLFDIETVERAFESLIQKGYATTEYIRNDAYIPHRYRQMRILYDGESVNRAYTTYGVHYKQSAQKPKLAIQQRVQPSSPQLTPEEEARRERERILEEERGKVALNNKRALKARQPATLTLEQWIETLSFFQWICAYCQSSKYELLEHFIPISHGGGTTQTNCVPACPGCNTLKQAWNPLSANRPVIPHLEDGFKRVQEYFSSL